MPDQAGCSRRRVTDTHDVDKDLEVGRLHQSPDVSFSPQTATGGAASAGCAHGAVSESGIDGSGCACSAHADAGPGQPAHKALYAGLYATTIRRWQVPL